MHRLYIKIKQTVTRSKIHGYVVPQCQSIRCSQRSVRTDLNANAEVI